MDNILRIRLNCNKRWCYKPRSLFYQTIKWPMKLIQCLLWSIWSKWVCGMFTLLSRINKSIPSIRFSITRNSKKSFLQQRDTLCVSIFAIILFILHKKWVNMCIQCKSLLHYCFLMRWKKCIKSDTPWSTRTLFICILLCCCKFTGGSGYDRNSASTVQLVFSPS